MSILVIIDELQTLSLVNRLLTYTDLLFPLSRNESSLVSALKTLLFFTILMVTLPIGLYFASKAYIFEGKSNFAL